MTTQRRHPHGAHRMTRRIPPWPSWLLAEVDQAAAAARQAFESHDVTLSDPQARQAIIAMLKMLDPDQSQEQIERAWLGIAALIVEIP